MGRFARICRSSGADRELESPAINIQLLRSIGRGLTKIALAPDDAAKSLLIDRRLRTGHRRIMPFEYENEGIDHRSYGLHNR